jgi:hypothetical protein
MAEPIYFVVERNLNGEEYASIYHDKIPQRLTRKVVKEFEKEPIIFQLRLDTLSNSEWWMKQTFADIYNMYKAGMLEKITQK